MAARSIFTTFSRNLRKERNLLRPFSSEAAKPQIMYEQEPSADQESVDDLKSRIFRVRLPKRSVTNVLQNWVSEGREIGVSELRKITKELRQSQRFKHALELSEWMIAHNECQMSDSDYAVRIELMTKVFGVDAAERYFESLPPRAKTSETYTSLLHCYAVLKLTEKAEQLYRKIKESDLSFTAITYNELMTLYMSVGQVEKVSAVVEDLKCQNVAPDLFTYNLWISANAAALKVDEVRRILDEMSHDPSFNDDWARYVKLVKIYLSSSNLVNSETNSVVETEKGITQREWITYDFLIILYGGLGNKDKLDQIWKSLRMTKQKMTSRNFLCILSSYLMLGNLKEVEEVIDQWKSSTTTEFHDSTCRSLSKAFAELGLQDKAAAFSMILTEECEIVDESQ
ncbi:pentatricopeptide repeat-containing protein At5g09450, mitochondrial [Daucus carota subsp. sativus]|uniref:Pentacotripeptide-repeat region of PRORP domain-containing protein n=2 Tax=Daucus carota subsp. sativus TaxID=79200 RepID=A0A175YEI2_DAUCS|nr:PREDICTED: pentatricopeptide repeat-containing protein At5g09450, mitochondrial [Daucus carota subsp. sativus]